MQLACFFVAIGIHLLNARRGPYVGLALVSLTLKLAAFHLMMTANPSVDSDEGKSKNGGVYISDFFGHLALLAITSIITILELAICIVHYFWPVGYVQYAQCFSIAAAAASLFCVMIEQGLENDRIRRTRRAAFEDAICASCSHLAGKQERHSLIQGKPTTTFAVPGWKDDYGWTITRREGQQRRCAAMMQAHGIDMGRQEGLLFGATIHVRLWKGCLKESSCWEDNYGPFVSEHEGDRRRAAARLEIITHIKKRK
jgi:hypothetical protein